MTLYEYVGPEKDRERAEAQAFGMFERVEAERPWRTIFVDRIEDAPVLRNGDRLIVRCEVERS